MPLKSFDVIKYEENGGALIYKHPTCDFNYGTHLIVHEAQEAVLLQGGKALNSFKPGTYILDSYNVFGLKENIINLSGGKDVFHCEVYFVNLTTQLGIKWGTDTKVRFFDPISGLNVDIGACGTFNIKVIDGRKLLFKVVGTSSNFNVKNNMNTEVYSMEKSLVLLKGLVIQKVKVTLAELIKKNNINLLEIDLYLDLLSEQIRLKINEVLNEYGMFIPEFFITSILTPDDDPNFRRLRELYGERYLKVQSLKIQKDSALAEQEVAIIKAETESKIRLIKAKAESAAEVALGEGHGMALRAQGADYNMETARLVGTKAAENQSGSGNIVNDLVKAGVGIGFGTSVAKNVQETLDDGLSWTCNNCGHKGNKGSFCENCGSKRS